MAAAADAGDAGRPSGTLGEQTPAAAAAVCSEAVGCRRPRRLHHDRCRSPSCPRPSVDCPRSSARRVSVSTAASLHKTHAVLYAHAL